VIDEDSLAGGVNTCFQEESRQGVTQSTGHNTGFLANDNTFFSLISSCHGSIDSYCIPTCLTRTAWDNMSQEQI